jgi:aspartyl-tRNA(Asn)/glutamyl-tRNA(Gln) amidotransferase subunit A
MTPTDLTIAQARDLLAKGEISSMELVEAHIDAMESNRELNAYITETPEKALAMAQDSDARRAKGEGNGLLEGIPVAIKDLFCTADTLTTAGSHILDGFNPFYESTVTTNMWREGAVMLGKTNLDEFAMGSSNLTSYHGPAINPWKARGDNRSRVPGGSSGGSASAVAGRLALGATGTDTGGSIRQPAAFTGTVGIKPTYGRCSRWGIVAFASSLDQAGPMTRSVRDAAIMLRAMAGHDPKDSTSADVAVPDFEAGLDKGVKGMTIGIPKEYRSDAMAPEIEGARTVEISLPHTKYALPAYYIVAPAEASSNLSRYDGVKYGLRVEADDLLSMYEKTRAAGFGDEVKRRILIGTYVLSAGYYDAYYLKAQKVRTRIAEDFRHVFGHVDAILTPATPSAAFPVDEPPSDPVEMYLLDTFTVPVNLAGLPGMVVPAGLSGAGLPLGLQVIGKAFDEETVLRVGRAIEQAADFDGRPEGY